MPNGIDALERYLVCQLAQVTLIPIVQDYVDRWRDAMENGSPLPDMLEIVEAAAEQDVPILTIASVDPYLRGCARHGRVPDPARVVTAIVHGFAEGALCSGQDLPLPRPPTAWRGPHPPFRTPRLLRRCLIPSPWGRGLQPTGRGAAGARRRRRCRSRCRAPGRSRRPRRCARGPSRGCGRSMGCARA